MAMTDMKRTKADKKAREKRYDNMSVGGGGDDYHHGLNVSLGHEELSKLGINKMPTVGDKLHLHAHAHVKSVSEDHRDGGKKERRVELELRKMQIKKKGGRKEGMVADPAADGAKAAMDKALAD